MTAKDQTKGDGIMANSSQRARKVWLFIVRIYMTALTAAVVIYGFLNFAFPSVGEALRNAEGFFGVVYRIFAPPVTALSNCYSSLGFLSFLGDTAFLIWSIILLIFLVIPAVRVVFCALFFRRETANPPFIAFIVFLAVELGFGTYFTVKEAYAGNIVPLMFVSLGIKLIGIAIIVVWLVKFRTEDTSEKVFPGSDGIQRKHPELFEKKDGKKD